MRRIFLSALVIFPAIGKADGLSDLKAGLRRLNQGEALQGDLSLKLWEEHHHRKYSDSGEASFRIQVNLSGPGLKTQWDLWTLAQADGEAKKDDSESVLVAPYRDALKELDPGRVFHLLNQQDVLARLIDEATFKGETQESFQGHPARVFHFTFNPRIPLWDRERLKHTEAALRIWTTGDGIPVASESTVAYWGKASRFFGSYKSQQRMETRYEVLNGHLVATLRTSEESRSDSDGAESLKVVKTFDFKVR